ncbi:MAG: hypothetical protein KDD04_07180, partial [Sinomicrobium sp.]|nr:hypothetical protein [Sinomicrobium sp.]
CFRFYFNGFHLVGDLFKDNKIFGLIWRKSALSQLTAGSPNQLVAITFDVCRQVIFRYSSINFNILPF